MRRINTPKKWGDKGIYSLALVHVPGPFSRKKKTLSVNNTNLSPHQERHRCLISGAWKGRMFFTVVFNGLLLLVCNIIAASGTTLSSRLNDIALRNTFLGCFSPISCWGCPFWSCFLVSSCRLLFVSASFFVLSFHYMCMEQDVPSRFPFLHFATLLLYL